MFEALGARTCVRSRLQGWAFLGIAQGVIYRDGGGENNVFHLPQAMGRDENPISRARCSRWKGIFYFMFCWEIIEYVKREKIQGRRVTRTFKTGKTHHSARTVTAAGISIYQPGEKLWSRHLLYVHVQWRGAGRRGVSGISPPPCAPSSVRANASRAAKYRYNTSVPGA